MEKVFGAALSVLVVTAGIWGLFVGCRIVAGRRSAATWLMVVVALLAGGMLLPAVLALAGGGDPEFILMMLSGLVALGISISAGDALTRWLHSIDRSLDPWSHSPDGSRISLRARWGQWLTLRRIRRQRAAARFSQFQGEQRD